MTDTDQQTQQRFNDFLAGIHEAAIEFINPGRVIERHFVPLFTVTKQLAQLCKTLKGSCYKVTVTHEFSGRHACVSRQHVTKIRLIKSTMKQHRDIFLRQRSFETSATLMEAEVSCDIDGMSLKGIRGRIIIPPGVLNSPYREILCDALVRSDQKNAIQQISNQNQPDCGLTVVIKNPASNVGEMALIMSTIAISVIKHDHGASYPGQIIQTHHWRMRA